MPTYDYKCDACGHEFEHFQQMSETPLRKCPKCGKAKLQRLIGTGAGIIFKGGGFYETDYRSEGYKKAAEADQKAAEPKTESKPETKTETRAEGGDAKSTDKPERKNESKSQTKSEGAATRAVTRPSNAKAPPKRTASRKSGRSK